MTLPLDLDSFEPAAFNMHVDKDCPSFADPQLLPGDLPTVHPEVPEVLPGSVVPQC